MGGGASKGSTEVDQHNAIAAATNAKMLADQERQESVRLQQEQKQKLDELLQQLVSEKARSSTLEKKIEMLEEGFNAKMKEVQDAIEFPLEELRVDYHVLKKQFAPHKRKRREDMLGISTAPAAVTDAAVAAATAEAGPDPAGEPAAAEEPPLVAVASSPRDRRGRSKPLIDDATEAVGLSIGAEAAESTAAAESEPAAAVGGESVGGESVVGEPEVEVNSPSAPSKSAEEAESLAAVTDAATGAEPKAEPECAEPEGEALASAADPASGAATQAGEEPAERLDVGAEPVAPDVGAEPVALAAAADAELASLASLDKGAKLALLDGGAEMAGVAAALAADAADESPPEATQQTPESDVPEVSDPDPGPAEAPAAEQAAAASAPSAAEVPADFAGSEQVEMARIRADMQANKYS